METSIPLWLYVVLSLVTPIIGFMVVIIKINSSAKNNSKNLEIKIIQMEKNIQSQIEERDFRIKQTILERSIDCMQQAYKNLMVINASLYSANPIAGLGATEYSETARPDQDKFLEQLEEVRNWYNENCFYLPKELRYNYARLILESIEHVHVLFYDAAKRKDNSVWVSYMNTYELLVSKFDKFMKKYNTFEIQ